MNIIALLESISLDKSKIGTFSKEDFTQIKKQLVVAKETNPEIEDSDITQLLKALKTSSSSFTPSHSQELALVNSVRSAMI